MRVTLSAAVVAMLFLCTRPWCSMAEDKKVCFSIVEEGRLEAIENDIQLIKENHANNNCGGRNCSYYLVSGEEYGVKDHQITASTSWSANLAPYRGRLYSLADRTSKGGSCWAASTNNNQQFIQVHLNAESRITGVVTQGRKTYDQWVTSYKLLYSYDGSSWKTVQDDRVFKGNSDRETPVTNHLHWPVIARYVRLQMLTWHSHISMRFDVLGCPLKHQLDDQITIDDNAGDEMTGT